jgi:hypothetical protein
MNVWFPCPPISIINTNDIRTFVTVTGQYYLPSRMFLARLLLSIVIDCAHKHSPDSSLIGDYLINTLSFVAASGTGCSCRLVHRVRQEVPCQPIGPVRESITFNNVKFIVLQGITIRIQTRRPLPNSSSLDWTVRRMCA